MAKASDEDLAAMVQNYKDLQAAQDETAQSIADLQTNFSEQMDLLTKNLSSDIEDMDFGEEAAEQGKATIEGFIRGANSMLPQVSAAYNELARAANNALTPGGGSGRSGNGYASTAYFVNAYAEGTKYAQEGAALVGEYGPELVYMRGGETVLTAKQTQAVMSSGGGGSRVVSVPVNIEFNGDASPETAEDL